jgi:enoyl-CoA hydratase/carnithine racemase
MKKLSNLSLKEREELFRKLRVSITHHSNAMEGTTLSFGETKELLEYGNTAGNKPLGEQLIILGFAKAYEHAIEAKKISAQDCLKYGIANKVVSRDELETITLEWAHKLSKRSSQSLNHTKRLMRESLEVGYWNTFQNEAEIQNELTVSDQNREAVKAFLEKREPNFD